MGLKIPDLPDDFEFVADCLDCYEPGKTPNYVFVRFWDVTACAPFGDPPNGYTFVCKQDPIHPCRYDGSLEFGGGTWEAYFNLKIAGGGGFISSIRLINLIPGWGRYFYAEDAICTLDFDNWHDPCPAWAGEGGHAHVTIFTDPIIILLTSGYHFCTIPGIFYEHYNVGIDHKVYRIAHTSDKTNILILLDEEDLVFDDEI